MPSHESNIALIGAGHESGNALFRSEINNGHDPDLKEFARQTLPKIEDHLKRALALAKSENLHAEG